MSRLDELNKNIKANLDKVTAFFAECDEKGMDPTEAPNEKKEEIKTLNQQAGDWMAEAKELKAKQDEMATMRRGAEDARKSISAPNRDLPWPAGGKGENAPNPSREYEEARNAIKTIGEIVTSDKYFLEYVKSVAPTGEVNSRTRIQTPAVDIEGGLKALLTGGSATSAGALFRNDRTGVVDAGTFYRPLTVRDIVTIGETNSDTVEYVRQGAHTNAAAPVAEASATSGSTGTKPESTFILSEVTAPVKTVAHWIPATRQALSDAPQLRTLIDNFLRYGLEEELEDQILTGSGTGNNFTGVLETSGTTAQAYDTSLLITTRRARTKVKVTGRANPTAYVMHPNDWEDMDLLLDGENRFYFGGPREMLTPRLWGLPVVESEAMTEGIAVVADWRLAVLWDRMRTAIYVSDSHADFFIRNLIAILAELRAAFGLLRPAAFVEIDLTA